MIEVLPWKVLDAKDGSIVANKTNVDQNKKQNDEAEQLISAAFVEKPDMMMIESSISGRKKKKRKSTIQINDSNNLGRGDSNNQSSFLTITLKNRVLNFAELPSSLKESTTLQVTSSRFAFNSKDGNNISSIFDQKNLRTLTMQGKNLRFVCYSHTNYKNCFVELKSPAVCMSPIHSDGDEGILTVYGTCLNGMVYVITISNDNEDTDNYIGASKGNGDCFLNIRYLQDQDDKEDDDKIGTADSRLFKLYGYLGTVATTETTRSRINIGTGNLTKADSAATLSKRKKRNESLSPPEYSSSTIVTLHQLFYSKSDGYIQMKKFESIVLKSFSTNTGKNKQGEIIELKGNLVSTGSRDSSDIVEIDDCLNEAVVKVKVRKARIHLFDRQSKDSDGKLRKAKRIDHIRLFPNTNKVAGSSAAVTVVYSLSSSVAATNKSSSGHINNYSCYCTRICLKTGLITLNPFCVKEWQLQDNQHEDHMMLPSPKLFLSTRTGALYGGSILAVLDDTKDTQAISLYDTHYGILMHSESLSPLLNCKSIASMLISNHQTGQIAILYHSKGRNNSKQINFQLATTRIKLGIEKKIHQTQQQGQQQSSLDLASIMILSSSATADNNDDNCDIKPPFLSRTNGFQLDYNSIPQSDIILRRPKIKAKVVSTNLFHKKPQNSSENSKERLKIALELLQQLLNKITSEHEGASSIVMEYFMKAISTILLHGDDTFGENGLFSLISLLPQIFVDYAMKVSFQILDHCVQSQNQAEKINIKGDKCIQSDTRYFIGLLISTGKVSARNHFQFDRDLSSMLYCIQETTTRSLISESKQTNGVVKHINGKNQEKHSDQCDYDNGYSPMDFITDILNFCKDISEHQMVMIMKFMQTRALSIDIVIYLREQHSNITEDETGNLSNISSQRQKRESSLRLCHEYLQIYKTGVLGDSNIVLEKAKIDMITNKVIILGCTDIFQRILSYSHYNKTLLRLGLRNVITANENETLPNLKISMLLLRMLFDILKNKSDNILFCSKTTTRNELMKKNSVVWLTAICDTLHTTPNTLSIPSSLIGPLYGNDENNKNGNNHDLIFGFLRNNTSLLLNQTKQILSMQDISKQTYKRLEREQDSTESAVLADINSNFSDPKSDLEIPPYSTERLVFF